MQIFRLKVQDRITQSLRHHRTVKHRVLCPSLSVRSVTFPSSLTCFLQFVDYFCHEIYVFLFIVSTQKIHLSLYSKKKRFDTIDFIRSEQAYIHKTIINCVEIFGKQNDEARLNNANRPFNETVLENRNCSDQVTFKFQMQSQRLRDKHELCKYTHFNLCVCFASYQKNISCLPFVFV